MEKDTNLSFKDISSITSLPEKDILVLQDKQSVVWFLSKKPISLFKQIIEEIEQDKPHWEIGDDK